MNIYISGLGINGKTSVINKLAELGYKVQYSQNRFYMSLIEPTKLAWDGRVVFFMKLVNYLDIKDCIFDRSLVDQLLIMNYANSGKAAYNIDSEVFGPELIDKYIGLFAESNRDSVHLLVKVNSDEFLSRIIDAPEFKKDPRSAIYQSVEQYRDCEMYFNSEFCDLMEKFNLKYKLIEIDEVNNESIEFIVNSVIKLKS